MGQYFAVLHLPPDGRTTMPGAQETIKREGWMRSMSQPAAAPEWSLPLHTGWLKRDNPSNSCMPPAPTSIQWWLIWPLSSWHCWVYPRKS
jgi:hypothetical protein